MITGKDLIEMGHKPAKWFGEAIEQAINKHSIENGSDTPDFILAEYLTDCLRMFDKAVNKREEWYGRKERE